LSTTLIENIKEYLKRKEEVSLAICYGDFELMITTTSNFEDKTLLIKEVVEMKDKAVVIIRPHRWGKSSNLEMLYYFFNQKVDKKGKIIEPQPHRVLFEGET